MKAKSLAPKRRERKKERCDQATARASKKRQWEPKFTLEEDRAIKDAYLRARYGDDSQSPLLWVLEKLHGNYDYTLHELVAKKIRWWVKQADYVNALVNEWRRDRSEEEQSAELELLPATLFFDFAVIAIKRRDYRFFEEVARLLREKIEPLQEDVVGKHVLFAYRELKQPGSEPTKMEVRERALTVWATWRLILRRKGSNPWDGEMPSSKDVETEKDHLPQQNWTQVFRRNGLFHLPNNKGGQPSHKKRS